MGCYGALHNSQSQELLHCTKVPRHVPIPHNKSNHGEPNAGAYPLNVRFGSLADICVRIRDVRFTPNSGHAQRRHQCPLCAISGLCAGGFWQLANMAPLRGLTRPRRWDQGASLHPTHLARWLLRCGVWFLPWSWMKRPRGCWTPEAAVRYCGLPWSPPHRSEFKRPPRR
jgi:hypothetical protein